MNNFSDARVLRGWETPAERLVSEGGIFSATRQFSIVSGSLAATYGAQSASDAQKSNEASVTQSNASNLILDLIARGAPIPTSIGSGRSRINFPAHLVGQSSAVLPYYFGGAESGLGNAATDLFNASFGLDSTRRSVPTSNLARYADPVSGEANAARDRALLTSLRSQLAAAGNSRFGNGPRIRERIAILENRLRGATPPEQRSGINPGVGDAMSKIIRDYQAQVAEYQPEFESGNRLISDVFSGELTNQMLGEAAPVQEARIKLANVEKDAGIEALQDKLNEIRTIQGRKGYSGDSSASQRLEFDARRRIGTDSARAMGAAQLTNAQQTQAIQGQGRDLMFRSLDVPYNRAQQSINLSNLPTTAAQQRFSAALSPFQFFRTSPASFNAQPAPERSSVPSDAQIALTALGRGNELAARAYLQNRGQNLAGTLPAEYGGAGSLPNNSSYFGGAYGGAAAAGDGFDDASEYFGSLGL